jgi:hypothetical protein
MDPPWPSWETRLKRIFIVKFQAGNRDYREEGQQLRHSCNDMVDRGFTLTKTMAHVISL